MPAIASRIDTRSDDFRSNAAALQQQVDDLRAKAAEIALGGDAKARERHARAASCCRASASSACSTRARPSWRSAARGHGMYDDEAPAAGMVAGIGRVTGRKS